MVLMVMVQWWSWLPSPLKENDSALPPSHPQWSAPNFALPRTSLFTGHLFLNAGNLSYTEDRRQVGPFHHWGHRRGSGGCRHPSNFRGHKAEDDKPLGDLEHVKFL